MSEELNKTKDEEAVSEEDKASEVKEFGAPITWIGEPTIFSLPDVILTDEPPIGAGACSFFFDLNFRIPNINNPVMAGDIAKYKLNKNYTGIASVLVFTERNNNAATVTPEIYAVQFAEQFAKLILTLDTNAGNKTITLPVEPDGNNGFLAVQGLLRREHDPNKKNKRPHRAKYFDPDSKVIAWKIVDSSNNVIVDGSGRRYEASGDDLYYFYISMYHNP